MYYPRQIQANRDGSNFRPSFGYLSKAEQANKIYSREGENPVRMITFNRKKHLTIFSYTLLLCVAGVSLMGCQDEEDKKFKPLYGRWKIYKYTELERVISTGRLDDDKINKHLLDKEVILHRHYIVLDSVKYQHPTYTIREEYASKYFDLGYRIYEPDIEAIGIKDEDGPTKIKILNIDPADKETWPRITWRGEKEEESWYFDEVIYYNGELGMYTDRYFFHLKKVD